MTYQADAIDIIMDSAVDFRVLCIEIAKSRPSVLVKAAQSISWEKEVSQAIKRGITKIEAIKLIRTLTGFGLKEAKEASERLGEWNDR